MPALQQEQDFPVAFAETTDQIQPIDDSTVFYVEWLDNSSEFPGLSTATNTNLAGGNWELLQRKETIGDEDAAHTVVPVEDSWSKIASTEDHPLYAAMVEKNAAELQPTKRILQPLWPNVQLKKESQEDAQGGGDDENNVDLGSELLDDVKSQSRRSNRLSRRRNLHYLKVIDYHVEGILRIATTSSKARDPCGMPEGFVHQCNLQITVNRNRTVSTEGEAKRYASRCSHQVRKHTCSWLNGNTSFQGVDDFGEFSVFTPVTKRY